MSQHKRSFKKKEVIIGEKIILKKVSARNSGDLYDLISFKGVLQNLTMEIENFDDFQKYILFVQNQWKLNNNFVYNIYLKKTSFIKKGSKLNFKDGKVYQLLTGKVGKIGKEGKVGKKGKVGKEGKEGYSFDKLGKVIGQISIYEISFTHFRSEIGIWIGKKFWNMGYGKKVLKLVIAYCFNNLNLNRIQAHVFTENYSSIKLFKSLGFKKEGRIDQYVQKGNKFIDVFLYSLLKQNYTTT